MKNWQENVIRNRQDYLENIKKIDWSQYETAYGNAGMDTADYINPTNNIPGVAGLLTSLLSESHKEAMKATHLLWCALCHQHALCLRLRYLPLIFFYMD